MSKAHHQSKDFCISLQDKLHNHSPKIFVIFPERICHNKVLENPSSLGYSVVVPKVLHKSWLTLVRGNGTIIKFTRMNRANAGISITRGSLRNSKRYFLTSFTEGLSGVPRFMSRTAVFNFII